MKKNIKNTKKNDIFKRSKNNFNTAYKLHAKTHH